MGTLPCGCWACGVRLALLSSLWCSGSAVCLIGLYSVKSRQFLALIRSDPSLAAVGFAEAVALQLRDKPIGFWAQFGVNLLVAFILAATSASPIWRARTRMSPRSCIIYRWGSLAGDRGKETEHCAWDAMASPSIRT